MFPMYIPPDASVLMDVLRSNGFSAYVVGGCVRDACMGKVPHDYDMTTDAKPSEILRCFTAYRTIETGIRHGTVTVISAHTPYEITTFRIDGDYTDHRHPGCVTFTNRLADDLSRRDFTVNAMAHDGTTLFDPFGGEQDVLHKCIRCVGEPDRRFDEDGLRILRALRFASTLSFSIEQATAQSLHRSKNLLEMISAERIYAELNRLLVGANAGEILAEFADVFRVVLPDLSDFGIDALYRTPPDRITRLALLTSEETLSLLRADKATLNSVRLLQREPLCDVPHLLHRLGEENAHRAVDLAFAKATLSEEACLHLHEEIDRAVASDLPTCIGDLAIGGRDLIAMGYCGSAVGQALSALLESVLCGETRNTRADLLSFLTLNK